jgi:hypothetical protein
MDGAFTAAEDHIQIVPRQVFLQLRASARLQETDEFVTNDKPHLTNLGGASR